MVIFRYKVKILLFNNYKICVLKYDFNGCFFFFDFNLKYKRGFNDLKKKKSKKKKIIKKKFKKVSKNGEKKLRRRRRRKGEFFFYYNKNS